jgi:hypothetical protein
VLTLNPFKTEEMKAILKNLWKPLKGINVRDLVDNMFLVVSLCCRRCGWGVWGKKEKKIKNYFIIF